MSLSSLHSRWCAWLGGPLKKVGAQRVRGSIGSAEDLKQDHPPTERGTKGVIHWRPLERPGHVHTVQASSASSSRRCTPGELTGGPSVKVPPSSSPHRSGVLRRQLLSPSKSWMGAFLHLSGGEAFGDSQHVLNSSFFFEQTIWKRCDRFDFQILNHTCRHTWDSSKPNDL